MNLRVGIICLLWLSEGRAAESVLGQGTVVRESLDWRRRVEGTSIAGFQWGRQSQGQVSIHLVLGIYVRSTGVARSRFGICGSRMILGGSPDSINVECGKRNLGVAGLHRCRVHVWSSEEYWGFLDFVGVE